MKISQPEWLKQQKLVCTVLEARMTKIRVHLDQFLMRPAFWFVDFWICLHMDFPQYVHACVWCLCVFGRGARICGHTYRVRVSLYLFFSYKGTNFIKRTPRSWPNLTLFICPKPHLQISSHWGLGSNIGILGEHKQSVHKRWWEQRSTTFLVPGWLLKNYRY